MTPTPSPDIGSCHRQRSSSMAVVFWCGVGPQRFSKANGRRRERMIVVEFESVDQAKRFYDSTEYQAARKVRESIAEMNMLVISGVDNQV